MSVKDLPYLVDSMTLNDLDAVMEIETVVHSAPWPASAYRHELEQNNLAHYIVVMPAPQQAQVPAGIRGRLRAWLHRPRRGRPILGYGGFWLMVGEAHISTIAVDPEWRGMGLGELLLLDLIERALDLEAEMVTLEVRISNVAAQNLYLKYQFENVGRRKRYYRDNNEDAYIMTASEVLSADYRVFLDEQWTRLQERFSQV
ncbi:MAG: ribosomal protein S18-alanine N-acetyltransferase [Ardenticatenales bacterium]|nr:ribosomal protein S18-alanine N-acetyltransferase [Ardenticatenales bacterium]